MTTITPAINRHANQAQVSLVQVMLLAQICRWESNPEPGPDGETTMTRVARWMGHSTAAATGLIDRLEKLGYVERTRMPEDRRKMLVRITRAGREFLEAVESDAAIDFDAAVVSSEGTGGAGALRTFASIFEKSSRLPQKAAA